MADIKCPACWNDIPGESENCPYCGFTLKTPQYSNPNAVNKGEYIERNNSIEEKVPYENIDKNEIAKKVAEKEKKNKRIIGVAICLIAIIIVVGVSNSKNARNKSAKNDYYDGYTGYSDYNAGTSYPKTGKEGALYKAKSYLNSSAFSYSGLIEQLEYEGFSESEATYGADNCGANWKDQALRKAQSYLNSSSFSESGLQEQLEYEGFTSDEASYGVKNCNADWKQQAAKKAASYLRSHSNWTRSDLIEQLEYEGFTYEQASYGASQNGL